MEIRDYIYIFRKRFLWFVTFFLLTLLVFSIVYLLQQKNYVYVNTLVYQPKISNLPLQIITKTGSDIQFTKSQEFWIDILKKKEFIDLNTKIFNYLIQNKNILEKLESISSKEIYQIVDSAQKIVEQRETDILELMSNNIIVQFTKDNKYLYIECAHTNKEIAYLLAVSLALSYIKFGNSEAINGIEELKQTYLDKINFFSKEAEKLVSPSQEKIHRLKVDYDSLKNIVNTLHERIIELYSDKISLEERLREASKYISSKTLPDVSQLPYKSEHTKMMEKQLFEAKVQLKSLQAKVTADHPEHKKLYEIIKTLTETIGMEMFKDLVNYYQSTKNQLKELENKINLLKTQKESFDIKLASLQNEYDKISYETSKLTEVKNETQILKSELTRLETILEQTPSYFSFYLSSIPHLKSATMKPVTRYKLLWLLLAIIIGISAAYARESMDTTIKSEFDIKKYLNLEILGIIPYTHKFQLAFGEEVEQKHLGERTILQELYVAAASIINEKCSNEQKKILTITCSFKYEGKSICAFNIAHSFATLNKKTLIIDGDARSPVLHKYFRLNDKKGVFNLFTDNINDFIIPITKNLHFLPAGKIEDTNTIEYLSKESIKEIIRGLKMRYDIILIDSPPLMNVSDSLMLAKMSDGIILVIASGEINRNVAKWSKHLLEGINVSIIGCILNKAFAGIAPSYYTYYYRYKDYTKTPKK